MVGHRHDETKGGMQHRHYRTQGVVQHRHDETQGGRGGGWNLDTAGRMISLKQWNTEQ